MNRFTSWVESIAISLGLGASLVLLVDYTSGGASLCSASSGCAEVKNSAMASIAGVPTPVFGLVFFALMLGLRIAGPGRPGVTLARKSLALGGASLALVFLATQAFVIGAFCKFCVVADLSALILCAASFAVQPARVAWRLGALSTVGALLFYLAIASTASNATPGAGETRLTAAAEGRTTIVEFVDFECPACRAAHKKLKELLAPFGDRVELRRKHFPLSKHKHALAAARAYCCAEEAGVAEPMADRLFRAEDLRPAACAEIAAEVGADPKRFASCMASERPTQRIAADGADAKALGVKYLPTLFVGDQRFVGVPNDADLLASVEAALL